MKNFIRNPQILEFAILSLQGLASSIHLRICFYIIIKNKKSRENEKTMRNYAYFLLFCLKITEFVVLFFLGFWKKPFFLPGLLLRTAELLFRSFPIQKKQSFLFQKSLIFGTERKKKTKKKKKTSIAILLFLEQNILPATRFELVTFRVWDGRSDQLS